MHFLSLGITLLAAFYFSPFTSATQSQEILRKGGKHIGEINQVAHLPEVYKPSKHPHKRDRRLIFIGDVHGAYDELVSLLEKLNYDSKMGITRIARRSH